MITVGVIVIAEVIVAVGVLVGVADNVLVWSASIIVGDIEGSGPDARDLSFVCLPTVNIITGIAANNKRIENNPKKRTEKKD
jgi:hypothetical protein